MANIFSLLDGLANIFSQLDGVANMFSQLDGLANIFNQADGVTKICGSIVLRVLPFKDSYHILILSLRSFLASNLFLYCCSHPNHQVDLRLVIQGGEQEELWWLINRQEPWQQKDQPLPLGQALVVTWRQLMTRLDIDSGIDSTLGVLGLGIDNYVCRMGCLFLHVYGMAQF